MTEQPFSIPAVALLLAAFPLALGLIPRNRFFGIRTATTMADDSAWYRVNRFGAGGFFLSGAIYLAVAWMFPTAGFHDSNFKLWLLHFAALTIPLVATVWFSVKYAGRLS